MGAWGVKSFENDDAADWVAAVSQGGDFEPVAEAIKRVSDSVGYLDSTVCCQAIAAAEAVAAMNGRPAADLPEDLALFVATVPVFGTPPLQNDARRAIERISIDSQLRERWDESHKTDRWLEALGELKSRLV